ncbi:hypothetical protein BH23CHL4_BH23CHL4_29390 [soil metagenome]
MTNANTFEPGRHLIKVNGSDYLEVKWRIAWLRAEHPDALVETELVDATESHAVFRARVTLPTGGAATGWGSEGFDDVPDFLEKAETKALGRALAALGFGTQLCPDFESAAGEVVDAPVRLPLYNRRRRAGEPQKEFSVAAINQAITDRQRNFLFAIAHEKGLTEAHVLADIESRFDVHAIKDLDRRQASQVIDALQTWEAAAIAS